MFPIRLSIVSYNIWTWSRWPERKDALRRFAEVFCPDILCLQELQVESQAVLDSALSNHNRVQDKFEGWTCEGNIYWNGKLFEKLDHGIEDVGILETHRRLFWVRLKIRETDRSLFVSTAHFTYMGNPVEIATGQSPRVDQAKRTIDTLRRLVVDEPAFFMGDLNDVFHPMFTLNKAGFPTCFAELQLPPPSTFPAIPTGRTKADGVTMNGTIDFLVSNRLARAVSAQVPHFYHKDIAASDHWPVLAVYEI